MLPKVDTTKAIFHTDIDNLPDLDHGYCKQYFFPNGYGASIVWHKGSYGAAKGLFELAVLEGNEEFHEITYDTPLSDDVLGFLNFAEIAEKLEQIKNL